ncbi:MAG: PolC-type DNA polymerase III [Gemmatimonas sp.]|uniref:3'-5' exonuclease n=1 Tax=Gemmatimonas sp. TaxID=1962908 RepID=UPI00391F6F47
MFGTSLLPPPTTLSARAVRRLANGPLDAVTLMRDVCRVERLQAEAAERMAEALLSPHPEFVRLPRGHWAHVDGREARTDRPDTGQDTGLRLTDIRFAVVDVETTGTRTAMGDRVTEIAIARVEGGAITDVFAQLVNPERPIPPYITALTHITQDMVRDQPLFRDVADEVRRRLQGAVFVAHNAAFDWRFVAAELRRVTGDELAGPSLCTVRLAKALLPDLPRRSLDHVTRYFGIEIEARHRAAGDAVATAHALCRLLHLAEREGIRTWAELDGLVSTRSGRRPHTAADRRHRASPLAAFEDHLA